MNGNLVVVQQHNPISRWFEVCGDPVRCASQIKGNLMVQAAHAGIADAPPIAKNGAMHMAKEQMSDARLVGGDDIIERLGILQHDPVHRCDASLERWVMHEQDDGAVGLVKFAIQPGLARRAICACVGSGGFCIKK